MLEAATASIISPAQGAQQLWRRSLEFFCGSSRLGRE
tara:strand:- start:1950 stop:2060 length:111 start_codon:yes stop_codon:yes gene_type:complete